MADPLAQFEAQVRRLLETAVREAYGPAAPAPPLVVETPSGGQADLAMACFPLAKALRQSPIQIAQTLAERIGPALASTSLVERAEAQAGYVNFFTDRARLAAEVLPEALRDGRHYGSLPSKGRRLLLEHTSANPNGPFHVGRARNPIIGDTLARVLRKAGWTVEVQYYLDDHGKQVAILAWGLAHLTEADLPPAEREKIDHKLVRYYQVGNQRREEHKTDRIETEIGRLIQQSEEGDAGVLRQFDEAYRPILDGMLESLARLGVRFDSFKKESDFIRDGSTDEVARLLQTTPLSRVEEDGALYLDLSAHGIAGKSQRFYFRRRDGTSLYPTRDVAYHLWKAKHHDRLINVLGEDHKLQATQVRIALELLNCPVIPEIVFYAFVSLPTTEGKPGKMSTRRGNVVFLDDLLDEAVDRAYEEVKKRRGDELPEARLREIAQAVGVGALRFNIIRVQPEKGIVFKWEEALNFEGASAPFCQYAYARCASILRKSGEDPTTSRADPAALEHPSELGLLFQIARLPRVVDDAARRDAPHAVANYALELANALSAFYRDCPVLAAENARLKTARLQVVAAVRDALGGTLDLLGVPILEEM